MIYAVLFITLSIGFYIIEAKSKMIILSRKTAKITNGLSKIMFVSPLLAFVVFAILFNTVLKGRLLERSSHALIVFMLWIYATSFYVLILKYFKNKIFLGLSVIGLIGSVFCAVFVTPLDRYCALVYNSLHEICFLIGGFMVVLWYFSFLRSSTKFNNSPFR